jgi:preprotein translocase subunit SecF
VFDLVGKRRWFYIFSLAIMIPGLIFIVLTPFSNGQAGLRFSIDFTGGTVWEVHFRDGTPEPAAVQAIMASHDLPGSAAITTTGDREYILIRTEQIGLTEQPAPTPAPSAAPTTSPGPSASPGASASPGPSAAPGGSINLPTEGRLAELRFALEEEFGPIDEVRQEANIGPLVSGEIAQQALFLLLLGSAGILGWMTFRFQDFRMGMTAIAALIHDVIVVLGVFAILGTFIGLEIDALFVTAMLTVIGFSVHDTIVVFDRVRENRIRHAGEPFAVIVNHSLLQTLGRSLNTSLTTVIVLLALLLFGSDAIRAFVFAMVVGIISGTYSSIFNASALLVDWHEWDERRRQRQFATARR